MIALSSILEIYYTGVAGQKEEYERLILGSKLVKRNVKEKSLILRLNVTQTVKNVGNIREKGAMMSEEKNHTVFNSCIGTFISSMQRE